MVSKDQQWIYEKFGTHTVQHILEHENRFRIGEVYKREEIRNIVMEVYRERTNDCHPVSRDRDNVNRDKVLIILKKQLPKEGETKYGFQKEQHGYYRYVGTSERTESNTSLGSFGAENGWDDTSDTILEPDRDFGMGDFEVYVWCLPQDENTGDRWAIKIGWAGPGGFNRRRKDFDSNLPVRPRYLIRIRFETQSQAESCEKNIHYTLKNRGHKIEGIPGDEWFKTNPDEIEDIIKFSDPNLVASG